MEWQGVPNRSRNSEITLVFSHVICTKTLGVRRAREIRARVNRRMGLLEKGIHTDLVGDAYAEGSTRESRYSSGGEEEDKEIPQKFHSTVMSGKLWQDAFQETNREGEGCLLTEDFCTKTKRACSVKKYDSLLAETDFFLPF